VIMGGGVSSDRRSEKGLVDEFGSTSHRQLAAARPLQGRYASGIAFTSRSVQQRSLHERL
jgi:hypothetical protein